MQGAAERETERRRTHGVGPLKARWSGVLSSDWFGSAVKRSEEPIMLDVHNTVTLRVEAESLMLYTCKVLPNVPDQ